MIQPYTKRRVCSWHDRTPTIRSTGNPTKVTRPVLHASSMTGGRNPTRSARGRTASRRRVAAAGTHPHPPPLFHDRKHHRVFAFDAPTNQTRAASISTLLPLRGREGEEDDRGSAPAREISSKPPFSTDGLRRPAAAGIVPALIVERRVREISRSFWLRAHATAGPDWCVGASSCRSRCSVYSRLSLG